MAEQKVCPTCGTSLAPHASSAYCPRCLLTAGLEDALDTGETNSPSPEGEELLFCTVAVLLRRLDPGRVARMSPNGIGSGANGISESLVERGLLARGEVDALRIVVSGILGLHRGDPESALDTLDPDGAIQTVLLDSASAASFGTRAGPPMRILSGHTDAAGISAVRETPGRYSHLGEYRRGGMGRVLLTHDAVLGRDVALKELAPGLELDTDDSSTPVRRSFGFLSRFLQEARITGQLEHPSIVPVYELGYRADRTLYYTMKLVRGRTLREATAECRTIQDRFGLLPHFIDLCQAIAYAHSRGVIHRDIKPENVMIGEFGETVVLDWGLAKNKDIEDVHAEGMEEFISILRSEGGEAGRQTEYGQVIGTPGFMAPEQAKGLMGLVNEQSDVYALGSVLYSIFNDRAPYEGDSGEIIDQIASGRPPLDARPCTPLELAAIWNKAMAHRPEDRYPTALALANEVQRFLTGGVVSAYSYRFSEHLYRFIRLHKLIIGTASVSAVLMLVVVILSMVRIESERRQATAHLYEVSIAHANEAVENNRLYDARQSLMNAPVEYRNWEWGLLATISHPDLLTLSGTNPLPKYQCAFLLANNGTLVTGGNVGWVRSWDIDRGTMDQEFRLGQDNITSVSADRNGRLLCAGDQNGLLGIWDLAAEQQPDIIQIGSDWITKVAFNPTGEFIAVADNDGVCHIWDTRQKRVRARLSGPRMGAVWSVAFTPDSRNLLTGNFDGTVRKWDPETGMELTQVQAHEKDVAWLGLDDKGTRLVTSGADFVTRLWSVDDLKLLEEFEGQWGGILSPDKRQLISIEAESGKVQKHSIDRKEPALTIALTSPIASRKEYNLDFQIDFVSQRMILPGVGGETLLYGLEATNDVIELKGHTGFATKAAFSPDSKRIATGAGAWLRWDDHRAILWDVATGRMTQILDAHSGPVNSLVFLANGQELLTGHADHSVIRWNIETGEIIQRLETSHWVQQISLFPDGKRMASAGWGDGLGNMGVQVWDLDTGSCLANLLDCRIEDTITGCLAVDPTGRFFAAGTRKSEVIVWDARTYREVTRLAGTPGGWVDTLAVSPDGHLLAVDDLVVTIWDTKSWTKLKSLDDVDGRVCFSPDGTRLVAGDQVIDTHTWRKVLTLNREDSVGRFAAYSPDGQTLVTGGRDKFVLWRSFAWQPLSDQASRTKSPVTILDQMRRERESDRYQREMDLDVQKRCQEALLQLESTSLQWALRNLKGPGSPLPALEEIIRSSTTCPARGKWELYSVGDTPRCSIHGSPQISFDARVRDFEDAVRSGHKEAIDLFVYRLDRLLPRYLLPVKNMAMRWLEEEDPPLATVRYLLQRVVSAEPDSVQYVEALGRTDFLLGAVDGAIGRFRDALAGGFQPALPGLLRSLATRSRPADLAEACQLIESALGEQNGTALVSTGIERFDWESAIMALRDSGLPEDPTLNTRLQTLIGRLEVQTKSQESK